MKKLLKKLAPIFLIVSLIGCTNAPSNKITQLLHKKYSEAKNLQWKHQGAGWEATFDLNGKPYVSLFDANDSWIQTKYEIDYDKVPLAVKNSFADKFGEEFLKSVFEIDMSQKTYYEIHMETKDDKYKVTYDSEGKFFERDKE